MDLHPTDREIIEVIEPYGKVYAVAFVKGRFPTLRQIDAIQIVKEVSKQPTFQYPPTNIARRFSSASSGSTRGS